jgi:membrane-bound lytic murein transglycosylase B
MIGTRIARLSYSLCLFLTVALPVGAQVDQASVDRAQAAFIDTMIGKHGFERAELVEMLAGATIDQRVIDAISRPAERVVPWYDYRKIFMNDTRIQAGAEFWREHAEVLEATAAEQGVDAEMIVAIIGIESLFGQRMGSYRVLDSLSTLAFAYPRRAAFFSGELESFLLMVRDEGPQMLDALGSYAGAMGAGQFIPSSYRAYAVDADGDGHRDLWQNWRDVIASVANYFSVHGWRAGEPAFAAATRPLDWTGTEPENGLDLDSTLAALDTLGYEFSAPLPATEKARILKYERTADEWEYWAGFHNYHVITRYNRSEKYALAAFELSQAIEQEYRSETD